MESKVIIRTHHTRINSLNSNIQISSNPDDEEYESDEEEEEEEEMDDEIVEYNFDPYFTQSKKVETLEENRVIFPQENVSKENINNTINSKHIDADDNSRYVDLFNNKIKNNFEKIFVNFKSNKNTLKNKHINNKNVYTHTEDLENKKSVFTKVSEEAYNQMIKNKNKVSSYDQMISDQYLKKVIEKTDPGSNIKLTSFLERSKNYLCKKSLQLIKERDFSKKIYTERTSLEKVNNQIRSPQKYMDDQMKFANDREINLNLIRENKIFENEKNLTYRPKISKRSESLVKNKKKGEIKKKIHDRLYDEGLLKTKDNFLNNINPTLKKEIRLTNKEISCLLEKLTHKDRICYSSRHIDDSYYKKSFNHRPNSVNTNSKTRFYPSSVSNRSGSQSINRISPDRDLTSNSSKLVIMRKLAKEFNVAVLNICKSKVKQLMPFKDYCQLIYSLGLVENHHMEDNLFEKEKIDRNYNMNNLSEVKVNGHNNKCRKRNINNIQLIRLEKKMTENYKKCDLSINENSNGNSNFNDNRKKESELLLIKDSWRILTKKKDLDGNESVELEVIMLFIFAVLGLYKGNANDLCGENENVDFNNLKDEISKGLKTSPNTALNSGLNTGFNSGLNTCLNSGLNTRFNSGLNTCLDTRLNSCVNNGFIEISKNNVIRSNLLRNTQSDRKFCYLSKTPSIEFKDNLIDVVIPHFDTKKYFFPSNIIRHLKVLFRAFYDNRYNFLISKKEEQDKKKLSEYANSNSFTPKITKESIKTAHKFREKLMMRVSEEETPNIIQKKKNYNRLKIQDAYDVLRRKKENELATQRKIKEDYILNQCTFTPNCNKNLNDLKYRAQSHEVTNRLYSHAMNKLLRMKSINEDKNSNTNYLLYEKNRKEYTFTPVTKNLNKNIFIQNPLLMDNLVKIGSERYERARIEKKLTQIIQIKGYNCLNKIKNFNELLIELDNLEQLPNFRFENESLTNKDDFNKFKSGKIFNREMINARDRYVMDPRNKIPKLIRASKDTFNISKEF